jgi:hypothetical protein
MKKIVCIIFTFILSLMLPMSTIASETAITVKVDGEKVNFDVQPIIENDRTLVPMRAIFEKLGAEVIWHEALGNVSATRGNITIWVTIGSNEMDKADNSKSLMPDKIKLDVPAKIISDRTFVPLRAISEAFDCDVDWDSNTSTVLIYTYEESSTPIVEKTPTPTAAPTTTATSKPVATEKPSNSDSTNADGKMSLTYSKAEKIIKKYIQKEIGDQYSDVTYTNNSIPVTMNNELVYEFILYSKSMQKDGQDGWIGTVYVHEDGSVTD